MKLSILHEAINMAAEQQNGRQPLPQRGSAAREEYDEEGSHVDSFQLTMLWLNYGDAIKSVGTASYEFIDFDNYQQLISHDFDGVSLGQLGLFRLRPGQWKATVDGYLDTIQRAAASSGLPVSPEVPSAIAQFESHAQSIGGRAGVEFLEFGSSDEGFGIIMLNGAKASKYARALHRHAQNYDDSNG